MSAVIVHLAGRLLLKSKSRSVVRALLFFTLACIACKSGAIFLDYKCSNVPLPILYLLLVLEIADVQDFYSLALSRGCIMARITYSCKQLVLYPLLNFPL